MTYVPKYLKLQRESVYKGSLVTSESNLIYLDIVDESMNPDQGFIDAETAGYLEPRLRLPGGYLVDGDIGMLIDAHSILPILHAFCGSYLMSASLLTGSALLRSYVFRPYIAPCTMRGELNANVEDVFGAGAYKARQMRGLAVRSIEISAAAREACTMTVAMFGAKDQQVARDASVTFPTVRPFTFADGTLATLGGDAVNIEAMTLRAERIVADDNFAIGSRYLPFLHAAGVTVTGSLDLGFRDWATFKKFWGASGATEPAAAPASYAIALAFTGDAIGTKAYKLAIDIPKVYLDTTNANIDRRERIIQSVDFTGMYDTTSGYGIRFTVTAKKRYIWKSG